MLAILFIKSYHVHNVHFYSTYCPVPEQRYKGVLYSSYAINSLFLA